MSKMTLEDYIKKYGVESGTRRYNGVQKTLEKRAQTYKTHPYRRLTKEWFIWRYPEDGIQRYENHVSKSVQSKENFIKRYGEIKGIEKYNETMSKKNTLSRMKEIYGEEEGEKRLQRRNEKYKKTWDAKPEKEKRKIIDERVKKIKKYNTEYWGDGKTKLEKYIEKYGENGPQLYGEHLQKLFKGIGYSKEAQQLILNIIHQYNHIFKPYSLFYRDHCNNNKEWFLTSNENIFFYDFCVKELKIILEYDGSKWHPTYEQYLQSPGDIIEILGKTIKEKFEYDQKKIAFARERGYDVYIIRSDMTDETKNLIIDQFIEGVKNRGKIFSVN